MKESIAELRKKCQVDVPLPWNLSHWKRYSIYLTKLFLMTKITPDQITLLWIFVGYVGAFFVGIGGYWNGLIGILLYQFALFLDYNDGEVARYRNMKHLAGGFLDDFAGFTMVFLLLLAMGIGGYREFNNAIFLWAGIVASSTAAFDQFVKLKRFHILIGGNRIDKIQEVMEKISHSKDRLFSIRNRFTTFIFEFFRFHILSAVLFAAVFGVLHWLVIIYAIAYGVIFIKSTYGVYKSLKGLQKHG